MFCWLIDNAMLIFSIVTINQVDAVFELTVIHYKHVFTDNPTIQSVQQTMTKVLGAILETLN